MIASLKYTLKVWLTTALTAPVILISIDYLSSQTSFYHFEEALSCYFIAVMAGLVFSIVTSGLFFISVYNLLKIYPDLRLLKPRVQITGVTLVLFTFIAFFGCQDSNIDFITTQFFWIISGPYLICLFASIHFYQLPQLNTDHQENLTT